MAVGVISGVDTDDRVEGGVAVGVAVDVRSGVGVCSEAAGRVGLAADLTSAVP